MTLSACCYKSKCNFDLVEKPLVVRLAQFDSSEISAARGYLIDGGRNIILDSIYFLGYNGANYGTANLLSSSSNQQTYYYVIKTTNRTDTISNVNKVYSKVEMECNDCFIISDTYSGSQLTAFTYTFNGVTRNGFEELVITK
jgi:hypothetical protein